MCNYAVSQTFLSLSRAIGYAGVFGIYAALAGLGGLLLHRYLPETAGLGLESVEALFHDPYPRNVQAQQASHAHAKPTEASVLLGRGEAKSPSA